MRVQSAQGMQCSPQEKSHPGTRAIFEWAAWQQKNGYPIAQQIAVFKKGDMRLVLYRYPKCRCVSVTKCDKPPKMRRFKEWKIPLHAVENKLRKSGWEPLLGAKAVNHDSCR